MAKKLSKTVRKIKAVSKHAAKALGLPTGVPSKTIGSKPLRSEIAKRIRGVRKTANVQRHNRKVQASKKAKAVARVQTLQKVHAAAPAAPAKRGSLAAHVASRGSKIAPLHAAAKTPRPSTTPADHTPVKVKPHTVSVKAAPVAAKAAPRHSGLPGRNLKVGKGHIPTASAKNRYLVIKHNGKNYKAHPAVAKSLGGKLRASSLTSVRKDKSNPIYKNHANRQVLAAWLKANR